MTEGEYTGVVIAAVGILVSAAVAIGVYIWQRLDRSREREQSDQLQRDLEWNDQHRAARYSAHRLIDRTSAIAKACLDKPKSGRRLRRMGVELLGYQWAVLEKKTSEWMFTPVVLPQIQGDLKLLESCGTGPWQRLLGVQRVPRHLQNEAAKRILSLNTEAKREVDKQYVRKIELTKVNVRRLDRWRRKNKVDPPSEAART